MRRGGERINFEKKKNTTETNGGGGGRTDGRYTLLYTRVLTRRSDFSSVATDGGWRGGET